MIVKRLRLREPYTIIILVSFIISYFFSYAVGASLFILGTLCAKKVNCWGYFFFIFLISVVAFTNHSDISEGNYDINRYYTSYVILHDCRSTSELLMFLMTSRDVFFYIVVWLSTFFLPSDPRWFGFFFTFMTSSLLFLAMRNFSRKFFDEDIISKVRTSVLFCLGFFLIVRFVDYTNGYRQHFAFALFLFFVSLDTNKIVKVLLLGLTCLVHTSNFLLLIFFYILVVLKVYETPRKLYLYSVVLSVTLIGLLLVVLGQDNYFVKYLLGEEELGIDNKIRVIMLLSTSMLYFTFLRIEHLLSLRIHRDLISNLLCVASTFLVISIVFISRSTMMIRFAFDWTDCIVVFSPIVVSILSKDVPIKDESYIRVIPKDYKFAIMMIWMLFIFYNASKLGSGDFEYKIFTEYGLFSSAQSIINSITPIGLI